MDEYQSLFGSLHKDPQESFRRPQKVLVFPKCLAADDSGLSNIHEQPTCSNGWRACRKAKPEDGPPPPGLIMTVMDFFKNSFLVSAIVGNLSFYASFKPCLRHPPAAQPPNLTDAEIIRCIEALDRQKEQGEGQEREKGH